MNSIYRIICCAILFITSQSWAAVETLQAGNAKIEISIYHQLITNLGITITPESQIEDNLLRLQFTTPTTSALLFTVNDGIYQATIGGELIQPNNFTLSTVATTLSLDNFSIIPNAKDNTFIIQDNTGNHLFSLDHTHSSLSLHKRTLLFDNMDLRISNHFAKLLGKPHYSGLAIGYITITSDVISALAPAIAKGELNDDYPRCSDNRAANYLVNFNADPDDDITVDVALDNIRSVQCRSCSPSDNTISIAPAVTLRNVGAADVPWFWRLTGPNSHKDPDISATGHYERYNGFISEGGVIPDYPVQHPYLVWALYHNTGKDIKMLGQSPVKHAFSAVNNNCNPNIICPFGQILWAENCDDEYGISTNFRIDFLAPRDEIEAHTATWNHSPSHFDPDGDLVFNKDGTDNNPDHERLRVATDDLLQEGDYYLEAWYIVHQDSNIFNSIGYIKITPTFDGQMWTFPIEGELQFGPVLNTWVNPQQNSSEQMQSVICSTANDELSECNAGFTNGEGHLQLAVKTTDLGKGLHQYNYALMNLDYDLQVKELRIPISPNTTISDILFADIDADSDNDWQANQTEFFFTWSAPDGNALDWGTLYTFSFVADAEPVNSPARLNSLEDNQTLRVKTLTPGNHLLFESDFEESKQANDTPAAE